MYWKHFEFTSYPMTQPVLKLKRLPFTGTSAGKGEPCSVLQVKIKLNRLLVFVFSENSTEYQAYRQP